MKHFSLHLFIKLFLFVILCCVFLSWIPYTTPQIYPISVYMGERINTKPRTFMIFDHINNGVIITLPGWGIDVVEYVGGTWEERGDTIVITPYTNFRILPDKGVYIYDDSICTVRTFYFGNDSIYADLKFLIAENKLIDVTLDYVGSPQKPTLLEYELVFGSPLNESSERYHAIYDGTTNPYDNNFPRLLLSQINEILFAPKHKGEYTSETPPQPLP